MSARYTPGPWTPSQDSEGDWHIYAPTTEKHPHSIIGIVRGAADAYLTAAAPDLLYAMAGLILALRSYMQGAADRDKLALFALETAERVIEKVEGHGHKYRARPVVVDGRYFASTGEANRYNQLLLLGRAGHIRNLELQPSWKLTIEVVYRADFRYEERNALGQWVDVTEDFKGVRTREYLRKRKALREQYGIEIRETSAHRPVRARPRRQRKMVA